MNINALIRNPTHFFQAFTQAHTERGWLPAIAGYYLMSFVQAYSDLLDARPDVATVRALTRAAFSTLVWLPAVVLLWGVLWLWLGARLVGGRPPLGATVKVIGYAILLPGTSSTLLLGTLLTTAREWALTPPGVYVFILASLAFAAWALTLCWKALRSVGALSVRATAGAFLWLPLVGIAWIALDEFILR